jgi:curved DNA-binding protein CbpA
MEPAERLTAKLRQVENGADHFALLELTQRATAADARAAYMALARSFHPDRAAGLGLGDRRGEFEKIFARLSEANSVLGDEGRRSEYLRILAAGGEEAVRKKEAEEQAMALAILEAEDHFRVGELYARRGQWAQAVEAFSKAVRNNPTEAEHHAYLAWAEFNDSPDKLSALPYPKQRLALALKHNEACAPAYYFLGHIYVVQGDVPRAAGNFQRAIDLRPDWLEPQRELRMLQLQEKNRRK